MSDPQAPDPAEPQRSLRDERRAAETVALNKDQLQQLQEQARQQAAPAPAPNAVPPTPGPSNPVPPSAAPSNPPQPASAAPANHLVLALGLAAAVVVVVLLLALFAS